MPFHRAFEMNWDFALAHPWYLVSALLLMPLNWGLEYLKYVQVLKTLELSTDARKVNRSFASGLLTGFVSPAYLGNFIGRMKGFQKEEAERIARLTIVSSLAQFTATILFGTIGLFLLDEFVSDFVQVPWGVYAFVGAVILLAYLSLDQFHAKWTSSFLLRLRLLSLSCMRYIIFSVQFTLVIMAFTIQDIILVWQGVTVVYLLMTISPSIFSGKLLFRELWTVLVFNALGFPADACLCAAFLVWVFNNLLPVLLAWVYIKRSSHE